MPKTVLITGGSSGNGLAAALQFATRGDNVAIVARGQENLDRARAEVEQKGVKCLALPADVSDHEALLAAARQVETELGPLDVWVNNAAVTTFGYANQFTPQEYQRLTAVNYLGVVNGTLIALELMKGRNRGAIVNTGSILAVQAAPLQAPYVASKFAVRGFTDAVRMEMIQQRINITLSLIILPSHNTPLFDRALNRMAYKPQPVPPVYKPELAGRAIVEAADTGKRELLVSATAVMGVMGSIVAPDLVERKFSEKAAAAQQTAEPQEGERPGNLFKPVSDPGGVHGRFVHNEKDDHTILEPSIINHALGIGGVALAGIGALVGRTLKRR